MGMAEKEYIEREAAITTYKTFGHLNLHNALEAFKEIPAADVRPVVRGRWETVMLDHERMGCRPTAHYCSECHQITWFRTFYCPNCGAKMEES